MENISMPSAKPAVARWGAACAACAASKSKCIRDDPTGPCRKCETLGKECHARDRRPRKKREVKAPRQAEIEERMTKLMMLLEGVEDARTLKGKQPSTAPNEDGEPRISQDLYHTAKLPPIQIPAVQLPTPPKFSGTSAASPNSRTFTSPDSFNSAAPKSCVRRMPLAPEDATPPDTDDVLLAIYTTQLVPGFPFVPLPADSTPAQLASTRPFLWRVIRMVSSLRSHRSMHGQSLAIMQHLSEAVMIRGERSLDLLQGVIVMVAFYHYHCLVHGQFNNLTMLAMAMVGDMNYHKPLKPSKLDGEVGVRSDEERRALLGAWYLSSCVAQTFSKIDSGRYTRYMDQVLRELDTSPSCETDALLVQLIRAQHLSDRVHHLRNKDLELDDLPGIPPTPVDVYLGAFGDELRRLREGLPDHLRENDLLKNHHNTTLLQLHEPINLDSGQNDSLYSPLQAPEVSRATPLQSLQQAHDALTAWFDHWLSIPVCYYFYMPVVTTGQLIYAVTMLSRWAKLCSSTVQAGRTGPPATAADSVTTASAPRSRPSLHAPSSSTSFATSTSTSNTSSTPSDVPALLTALRHTLTSHPHLLAPTSPLSVPTILDRMVSRFESARREISAAHGGVWRNGLWDLAAEKVRVKRALIERWSEVVNLHGGEALLFGTRYWGRAKDNAPQGSKGDGRAEKVICGPGEGKGFAGLFDPCIPNTGVVDGSGEMSGGVQIGQPWQEGLMDFSEEQDLFAGMDFSVFWDDSTDWLGRP